MIVRTDQADFVGHRFGSEAFQGLDIGGSDQAGDHVAPPLDRTDNRCLARSGAGGAAIPTLVAAFVEHIPSSPGSSPAQSGATRAALSPH